MSEWNHSAELVEKTKAKHTKSQRAKIKKLIIMMIIMFILCICLFSASASETTNNYTSAKNAFKNGEYQESIQILESLYQSKPDDIDILLGLYANYRMYNQLNHNKVKEKILNLNQLKGNIATYNLTEQELIGLIKDNPEEAVLYHQFALKKAQKNQWESVNKLYQKAHHLNPSNEAYKLNIAISFDHIGMINEAMTWYQKVNIEKINEINRYELTHRLNEYQSTYGKE